MRHALVPSLLFAFLALGGACSATGEATDFSGSGGAGSGTGAGAGNGSGGNASGGNGSGGVLGGCGTCNDKTYTPCDANKHPGAPIDCPVACAYGVGCVMCSPGTNTCVGNEVHKCSVDGTNADQLVEVCDVALSKVCKNGACQSGCEASLGQPSNVGCEFWAVDLDQVDKFNDPASAPWGVVLSNAGQAQANVTIELNDGAPGQPLALQTVKQVSVPAGSLQQVVLPTRELDCGAKPNDYKAPGTCLSSRAYRITSSSPIVVYQFNTFENSFSNDASLLLPTNALGKYYRVLGWGAGHPFDPIGIGILDRSYVTIVGVEADTSVTVKPSYKIRGNPPIAATAAGGEITVTLGKFDVLNLETDDGSMKEDPKTMADLSGTLVTSSKPVAVFSGTESTGAPGSFDIPKGPNWQEGDSCCLDHLEEQMFPVESVGMHYVIPRSPVRSKGGWQEPDMIRFVGVAEVATVTTSLAPPFDHFDIAPGEVKTTWTQTDFWASMTKPVQVGQILISQGYLEGALTGDPSLTVYPPVEQFRTEYVILTPGSWDHTYVVIAAPNGANVTLDGQPTTGCDANGMGTLEGVAYTRKTCPVAEGVHSLTGDQPFGIVAYGYGNAGSYAHVGGADVKKVYDPPPIK